MPEVSFALVACGLPNTVCTHAQLSKSENLLLIHSLSIVGSNGLCFDAKAKI